LAKQNNYDLILMDMQMPLLNGIEATKIIRNDLGIEVPIVGLSANTVESDIKMCMNAGMNDYISKPFTMKILKSKIGKILNLKELSLNKKEIEVDKDDIQELINLDYLKKIAGDNKEFFNKMVGLFLNNIPIEITGIKRALGDMDYEGVSKIAHKIKPSFQIIGVASGFKLCEKIESYDGGVDSNLSNLVLELDKTVSYVVAALNRCKIKP